MLNLGKTGILQNINLVQVSNNKSITGVKQGVLGCVAAQYNTERQCGLVALAHPKEKSFSQIKSKMLNKGY